VTPTKKVLVRTFEQAKTQIDSECEAISFQITETAPDYSASRQVTGLQYKIAQNLRDKYLGYKSKPALAALSDSARKDYNHKNRYLKKMADQIATLEMLKRVTMSKMADKAISTGRLALAAQLLTRFFKAIAFACEIKPETVGITKLRLEDVGKPRAFVVQKVFDSYISDLKRKHICQRTNGEAKCEYLFCNDVVSCETRLAKKARWMAMGSPTGPREKREHKKTGPLSDIPETLDGFLTDLGYDTKVWSDAETENYLATLSFFGIYINGGREVKPQETCDVITEDRLVSVPAKADVKAIKEKKLAEQIRLEEVKAKKIEDNIKKLTKLAEAKGSDYASPQFIRSVGSTMNLCAGNSSVDTFGDKFIVRATGEGITFSAALEELNNSFVKMQSASGVEQPLSAEDTEKKMTLKVKGIANSDNACWAHAYSVLKQLKDNPDMRKEDFKLLTPDGTVLLDNGLSADKMIEHYGMKWDNTAFFLDADYNKLSGQTWYGGDPTKVTDRFYLSKQVQDGKDFLHCEPITEVHPDQDIVNDAISVTAGALGEGLIINSAPSSIPMISEIQRTPGEKPQLEDTQNFEKYSLPKSLHSESLGSTSNPLIKLLLTHAAPYLQFEVSASQFTNKDADYHLVEANNVYAASFAMRPEDNAANQLNNRIEIDRISFSTPTSTLSLNAANNAFGRIALPVKYYHCYTDLSFNTMPSVTLADVTMDLIPKKVNAVMANFEADTAFVNLQQNRFNVSKLMARLDVLKNQPGSNTSVLMSTLIEIHLRHTRLDLNILNYTGGLVPHIGRGDQALQFLIKDGFAWEDAAHQAGGNAGVNNRPTFFPLLQELDGAARRHFPNRPYYNEESSTIPCSVVPTWMAAYLFQGNYHGEKGNINIIHSVERICKQARVLAAGGYPIADVESTLRAQNPALRNLQWKDAAGNNIGALDLIPTTAAAAAFMTPWGQGSITPANGPVNADMPTTMASVQRLFKRCDELSDMRNKLSSQLGGTGDYTRLDRFKDGLARYQLLPEFNNLDEILPIYVPLAQLNTSTVTLAEVIGGLPKPMLFTKRRCNVHTPEGGFTSYVYNQPINIANGNVMEHVDFMANVQQLAVDTKKRSIMIIIGGVNELNFNSDMNWFGPVRAVPNRDVASGLAGNLNKFLLPFKCQYRANIANVGLSWVTKFPANEGIDGLWDTAQDIGRHIEASYINLSSTSCIKALDRLLNRGATEDELRYCMWIIGATVGQAPPLPHVGPQHDLYNPHTLSDQATRLTVLGRAATGFAATHGVANANAVVAARPDLTDAFRHITNALGMTAYQTVDGAATNHQNKQYTLGTMRGLVDFGIELGYLEIPNKTEWAGIALFEPRAYVSAAQEASRQMLKSFDKMLDMTGKTAYDMMQSRHNVNMDEDDMYLAEFWSDAKLSPHRMAAQFFNSFFPKQTENNFRTCVYSRELRNRGNELDAIRDGYMGKTLKRVPRAANQRYDDPDVDQVRFKIEKGDVEETTFGNNHLLRWKLFEDEEGDKKRPNLSLLPWKYVHNNQVRHEINRAGLTIYKQERPETYRVSLQMTGTEDRIKSFNVSLHANIRGIYGFTSPEVIDESKQFIMSAGYGTIMREYKFNHFTPGVQREYRVASGKTENFLQSLEGARSIINRSSIETLTYRTDNVFYVAEYKTVRSGFTF